MRLQDIIFSLLFLLIISFYGCGKGERLPLPVGSEIQQEAGGGFLDAAPAISGAGIFFSDETAKALDAQGRAISTELAPFLRKLTIGHVNVGNIDIVAAATSVDKKKVFLLVVIDHTTLESRREEKVESLVLSAPIEDGRILYRQMQYHELVGIPFGVLFCAMTRIGEAGLLLSTGEDLLQFERGEGLSAERGFSILAGDVFQLKKMYTRSSNPQSQVVGGPGPGPGPGPGIVELFPGKNQTIFAVSGSRIFDFILDDVEGTFSSGTVQIDFGEPLGGGEFDFSQSRIIAASRSGNKVFFTSSQEVTEIQNIFEMPLRGVRDLSDILLIENKLIPTYGNCGFKKCPSPLKGGSLLELRCLNKREPLGETTFVDIFLQSAPLHSIWVFDCPVACCPLESGSDGDAESGGPQGGGGGGIHVPPN